MRFYGYFRSSAAYRCRIAFGLKGVSPALVPAHLRRDGGEHRKPDYLALNPQGLVPAMVTDSGAVLTQSLAIVEWLEETHPTPPLLPAAPEARAQVRAFALAMSADIHPITNLRVLNHLKSAFGADQDAVDAWVRHWCETGLEALERVAQAQNHGGAFAFGDAPGLADICLVPQLAGARRFGCDTQRFVRLSAIERACAALPAFDEARPDRQPDAEA